MTLDPSSPLHGERRDEQKQEEGDTRVEGQPVSEGRPTAASHEAAPRLKDAILGGELARAKRRALRIFDEWQRCTGCLEGSSYQWEVESIIADAVEIGVQAAYGIHRPLESEQADAAVDPVGELAKLTDDHARQIFVFLKDAEIE